MLSLMLVSVLTLLSMNAVDDLMKVRWSLKVYFAHFLLQVTAYVKKQRQKVETEGVNTEFTTFFAVVPPRLPSHLSPVRKVYQFVVIRQVKFRPELKEESHFSTLTLGSCSAASF